MFSCEVLEFDGAATPRYSEIMNSVFSNLPPRKFGHGVHIALKSGDDVIIGGATLEHYSSLSEDFDLQKHWEIQRTQQATRILRVWSQKPMAIKLILATIIASVPADRLLYGILSLPLSFAKARAGQLDSQFDWLSPRTPFEDCCWPDHAEPSSAGKKLLSLYLTSGARFLGQPSGDLKTQSVRVVMGAYAHEIALPSVKESYAPSHF